jgi:hypothetical protein
VVVLAAAVHLVQMRVVTLDQREQRIKGTLVAIPQDPPAIMLPAAAAVLVG